MSQLHPATAEDYAEVLEKLLPPGRLMRILLEGTVGKLGQLLLSFGEEPARFHNRMIDVLTELIPWESSELLGSWERVAGLPDPCAPTPTTDDERRAALLAHFAAQGGQTSAYFVDLAEKLLGVTVTIDPAPFTPFTTTDGSATPANPPWTGTVVGDALYDQSYTFMWRTTAPAALTTAQRARLECFFRRYKPAQSDVIFVYA